MARYIDADKLIAHLKDEIEGCKQSFNSRANGKGIAYGTELGLKSAISFANTLAIADVVPKSEVENGILTTDKLTLRDVIEHYQKAFTGQIFEELDGITDLFAKGLINELEFYDMLAELKKKYTESDNSIVGTKWKFDEKLHTEQPDLSNVKFIDKDGNITNRDDALDWNEALPLEESEGGE